VRNAEADNFVTGKGMKKQYRMAIENIFFAELQKIDPDFKKITVKSPVKYDGEAVFAKITDAAALFICLIPNPKGREEFTVEIGWSSKHRFPELTVRPNIFGTDIHVTGKDEGMIRLTEFINTNSFGWGFKGVESIFNEKYFADPLALKSASKEQIEQDLKHIPTESEATETVKSVVYESISILNNYGLPYLRDYLKS
jgi:hypothetical protein